jgi:hypothetical protein
MNINNAIVTAVAGLALVPAMSWAGTVGGVQYASQYDFREFFAVTDHHDFHVVLAGNPFPGNEIGAVARDLLPAMQANKPRPALTFTYDPAVVEKDQPDYRLMLIFDAANDLDSKEVCNGVTRFKAGQASMVNIYAVYCRNDKALSETTAWTSASGSNDPRVGQLFKELFQVVFNDAQSLRPSLGDGGGRN